MINGVGLSEILLIVIVILFFFGSKELPRMLREMGKVVGKAQRYSDALRRELNGIARVDEPASSAQQLIVEEKKQLRRRFSAARSGLSEEQRRQKTAQIADFLYSIPSVQTARSIMLYLHIGAEVQTDGMIARFLSEGKRLVVPFCQDVTCDLGLAAITDVAVQTAPGTLGIKEPIPEIRNNFFKSDLDLIIVPGIAFDLRGGRLGRGKGYYDRFLRELRGRIPIIGICFECQHALEPLPFSYADVPVDQIITETGMKLNNREDLAVAKALVEHAGC